ncbi:MAG: tRNA 2-thiouridine(34) synthase MnmA [Abditibacteriota bacterium]|nr:tRNA 2-thiouridine(34) synthase MnmA [Abditibacteriota bacterium]
MDKIALLMSGGTDSSAAALLLQRQGWEVVGVTFPVPSAEGVSRPVPEAAELARRLGIEHLYIDVTPLFEEKVLKPFRQDYMLGRTPCPCAECNRHIKFGFLWDLVRERLGIDHFATGHYARAFCRDGSGHLAMAQDRKKDQSYFLYGIRKERLPYLHFPLADYTKDRIRELVLQEGLFAAPAPESMELCFAGDGGYREAVAAGREGPVVLTDGRVLGTHSGIEHYTIGQRKGLGIPYTAPLYVVEIDRETDTVVLGEYGEGLTDTIEAGAVNALEPEKVRAGERLFGKIRSTGRPKPCRIEALDGDALTVRFEEEFFITSPGQKIVLYDAEGTVAAGGTIEVCRRKNC